MKRKAAWFFCLDSCSLLRISLTAVTMQEEDSKTSGPSWSRLVFCNFRDHNNLYILLTRPIMWFDVIVSLWTKHKAFSFNKNCYNESSSSMKRRVLRRTLPDRTKTRLAMLQMASSNWTLAGRWNWMDERNFDTLVTKHFWGIHHLHSNHGPRQSESRNKWLWRLELFRPLIFSALLP